MAIATIGYEGKTQAQMIDQLKAAGVELVVDVRAVAASRRPGFSKTILGASLEEAGIGYEHLRGLGTPKAGRDAARAGRGAVGARWLGRIVGASRSAAGHRGRGAAARAGGGRGGPGDSRNCCMNRLISIWRIR